MRAFWGCISNLDKGKDLSQKALRYVSLQCFIVGLFLSFYAQDFIEVKQISGGEMAIMATFLSFYA